MESLPRPEGYSAITPWLISKNTPELIDFISQAFGGVELARVLNADGGIGHAEMRIVDAIVMLFDSPEGWPTTASFLRLYVPDALETHRTAIAAGATNVTDVTELAFGDLVGRVQDFAGNIWWIQTHVEDVDPDQMNKRWADPRWVAAMQYVQTSLTERGAPV